MSDPREVVERLYKCFAARDGAGMAACYAPDATFSDPVFTDLSGAEVGGMWKMLTARSNDLVLELDGVTGDASATGESHYIAHWTARYTFTQTKRKVVNRVTSNIDLKDGKIVRQRDDFDLAVWMTQALGPIATLLGWTGLPASTIRKKAKAGLTEYLKKS